VAQVHYDRLRPLSTAAEFGRWSVPGQVDLREWDGEFVVRTELTAQTYLLSALAGEALKAIRSGAIYLDQIAAQVYCDCVAPSAVTAALVDTFAESAVDTQSLLAVLSELEMLGLARADLT
jgi:hypothetical protein